MSRENWSRGDRFGALATIPVLALGALLVTPALRAANHDTGCRPAMSFDVPSFRETVHAGTICSGAVSPGVKVI